MKSIKTTAITLLLFGVAVLIVGDLTQALTLTVAVHVAFASWFFSVLLLLFASADEELHAWDRTHTMTY